MDKSRKNIYVFNALKSPRLELSRDYGFLLSSLLNLESELSTDQLKIEDFASALSDVFTGFSGNQNIVRVCLSLTFPFSRRIQVISSVNNGLFTKNTMMPGYSCYISKTSSLFHTPTGEIRIYSDIEDILDSFRSQGLPVQRSIKKLHEMGIRSGLTIPLKVNELVSGFFFLNSDRVGAFSNFKDEDYLLLCTFRLVALSAIQRYIYDALPNDGHLVKIISEIPIKSEKFDKVEFKSLLEKVVKLKTNVPVQFNVKDDTKAFFFYPTKVVVFALVSILLTSGVIFKFKSIGLKLSMSANGANVILRVENKLIEFDSDRISFITKMANAFGMKFQLKKELLELVIDFQRMGPVEESVGYSV